MKISKLNHIIKNYFHIVSLEITKFRLTFRTSAKWSERKSSALSQPPALGITNKTSGWRLWKAKWARVGRSVYWQQVKLARVWREQRQEDRWGFYSIINIYQSCSQEPSNPSKDKATSTPRDIIIKCMNEEEETLNVIYNGVTLTTNIGIREHQGVPRKSN